MAAVGESGASSGSDDPYARLGLAPGASFDEVQAARNRCLAETDNDPQAKARVEAAYDAVLMARLRERQQGQVSAAAATASQKEESSASASPSLPGVSVLQRLRLPQVTPSMAGMAPSWSLVEGQGLVVRLFAGVAALLLLLFSPGAGQLVLALGLIGCFLSQVRRGRRPLPSLGWSLLVLGLGLVVGSVLTVSLSSTAFSQLNLSLEQVQAIPAALLLWLAALLLA